MNLWFLGATIPLPELRERTVIIWDLAKIYTLKKLAYACDWVRDYLQNNPLVEAKDRNLCDGVKSDRVKSERVKK